ncbi:C4-dicarboxylate TRAP transporter large permease protein DctM [subsurface metagenome]
METMLFGIPNLGFYISLLILVGLLVTGVPAPFCFMASLAFLVYLYGLEVGALLPMSFFNMSSLTIIAAPLFIMAGGLMGSSGIATRLIAIAKALVGRLKGGLGAVMIVACAMSGAIAGTCSAAVAAIGSILIPEMEKEGYSRGYATGLVAVASVLGQLIPPSVPMILFAFITRLSVAACFLTTVGPGIITIIIYSIVNYFMVRNNPNIKVLPPATPRQQVKELAVASYRGFFALLIPVIIFGGIYGGIMTPTEAAAVAVVSAVLIGLFGYRTLNLKGLSKTFQIACTTIGVVMLVTFFVMMLSRVYTMLNIPQNVIATVTGISENYYVMMLMINVFLLFLGTLIEDFSGTLLAAPLLFPLIKHMGVNPYHFAAILGTNLGLGNVTPPTAEILYLSARIGNVTIDKMIKPALIFMVCGALPVVLITAYWPDLSLFIPRLVMPDVVG